jgi:hypothetical protein
MMNKLYVIIVEPAGDIKISVFESSIDGFLETDYIYPNGGGGNVTISSMFSLTRAARWIGSPENRNRRAGKDLAHFAHV